MTKEIRQEFARLTNDYLLSRNEENKFEGDAGKFAVCKMYLIKQTSLTRAQLMTDLRTAYTVAEKKQIAAQTFATWSHQTVPDINSPRLQQFGLWGSTIASFVDTYFNGMPTLDRLLLTAGIGLLSGVHLSRYFPEDKSGLTSFAKGARALEERLTALPSENAEAEQTANNDNASEGMKKRTGK